MSNEQRNTRRSRSTIEARQLLAAWTPTTYTGPYPPYVNVSQAEGGIVLTVRGETKVDGSAGDTVTVDIDPAAFAELFRWGAPAFGTRDFQPTTEIEAIERLRFCKDNSEMFQARTVIELECIRDNAETTDSDRDTVKDALKLIAQLYLRKGPANATADQRDGTCGYDNCMHQHCALTRYNRLRAPIVAAPASSDAAADQRGFHACEKCDERVRRGMGSREALLLCLEERRCPASSDAAPEQREPSSVAMRMMQDDIAELLRILKLGDHARPVSPAVVMRNEVIPTVRALVERQSPAALSAPDLRHVLEKWDSLSDEQFDLWLREAVEKAPVFEAGEQCNAEAEAWKQLYYANVAWHRSLNDKQLFRAGSGDRYRAASERLDKASAMVQKIAGVCICDPAEHAPMCKGCPRAEQQPVKLESSEEAK
jgi:hypothetical protein